MEQKPSGPPQTAKPQRSKSLTDLCAANLEPEALSQLDELENLMRKYKHLKNIYEEVKRQNEIIGKCVVNGPIPVIEQLTLAASDLEENITSIRQNYDEKIKKKEQLLQQIKYLDQRQELLSLKKLLHDRQVSRRQVHNELQDLKGNTRVFCRVRPPVGSEESERLQCLINYFDEKSFEIRKSRESASTTGGKPTDFKAEFSFDRVFQPDSSQEEIFEDLAQLVQSALDGYDICVFAYGQTGSGKTYTMQGGESQDKAGMIPRTADFIFSSITNLRETGWTYEVKASFLEIYNETVRDLLRPNAQNLEICFNEGRGTMVTNLTIQSINTADELKKWMQEAQRNRSAAATDFNEHSSRSHAVTKIYLQGLNKRSLVTYTGSVNFVDLAGSESTKTMASERLVTKNINRSLFALGEVMLALYNKEKHIPYRNSKLTYFLQSSLRRNSITLMVVHISPFEECYAESISSLQFGTKLKEVKMTEKRN